MSDTTGVRCDSCEAETSDRYIYKGWIRIEGNANSFRVIVSHGRKLGHGDAITGYKEIRVLDFCGMGCLTKWFEALSKPLSSTKAKGQRK